MSSCQCRRSVVAVSGTGMLEIGDGSNIWPLCFYAADIALILSLF